MLSYLQTCLENIFFLLLSGVFIGIVVAVITQGLSSLLRAGCGKVFGDKFFIYLTAPGIMIHELGHLFFCVIFGHKIKEVKLFSPEDDGTLGYVSHVYQVNNLYHRIGNFFIGTGPVWFGLLVLYLLSLLLLPGEMMAPGSGIAETFGNFFKGLFSFSCWSRWQFWLWFYLAFSVTAHITLSRPDLKGAADGLIFLLLFICLSVLLLGWCGSWEEFIIDLQWRCWSIALPVIIIFILFSGVLGILLNSGNKRR